MSKNIVICSDGTGNTAVKGRGTNVFRIFESVDLHGWRSDPKIPQQFVIYDDGVGTQGFKPLRLLTGAFGWGLSHNVKQLYAALARVYEPGDRIYLFGFSRGAFTVRTLAGLITECGVVCRRKCKTKEKLDEAVDKAYKLHRELYHKEPLGMLPWHGQKPSAPQTDAATAENAPTAKRKKEVAEFHADYGVESKREAVPGNGVDVEFVGVWDTVDAVGLPFKGATEFWNSCIYRFKFPDYKLDPRVRRAAHALAIDDERLSFHPLLWNEKDETPGRIQQVWFAGAHSNVGGGYAKQGMSVVALDWMMAQAEDAGLRFNKSDREYYQEHANVDDHLYNSRAGAAIYYRYKPRNIEKLCEKAGVKPKVHISAVERLAHASEGYSPGNLPLDAEVVLTDPKAKPTVRLSEWLTPDDERSKRSLKKAKTWINMQRSAHWALVLVSLAIVYFGRPEWTPLDGFFAKVFGLLKPTGIWEIVKKLLTHWYGIVLLAAVPVVFVASRLARRWMNAVFSLWWHSRRDELQESLARIAGQRPRSGLPAEALHQRGGGAVAAAEVVTSEWRSGKTEDF